MTTPRPTLEQTIGVLIHIRDTAVADLSAAKDGHPDPEWRADRIADICRCNRELERLGVRPD